MSYTSTDLMESAHKHSLLSNVIILKYQYLVMNNQTKLRIFRNSKVSSDTLCKLGFGSLQTKTQTNKTTH
jgi:hypothetical protein